MKSEEYYTRVKVQQKKNNKIVKNEQNFRNNLNMSDTVKFQVVA